MAGNRHQAAGTFLQKPPLPPATRLVVPELDGELIGRAGGRHLGSELRFRFSRPSVTLETAPLPGPWESWELPRLQKSDPGITRPVRPAPPPPFGRLGASYKGHFGELPWQSEGVYTLGLRVNRVILHKGHNPGTAKIKTGYQSCPPGNMLQKKAAPISCWMIVPGKKKRFASPILNPHKKPPSKRRPQMPSGFPWKKGCIRFWLVDFTGIGSLSKNKQVGKKRNRNPPDNWDSRENSRGRIGMRCCLAQGTVCPAPPPPVQNMQLPE